MKPDSTDPLWERLGGLAGDPMLDAARAHGARWARGNAIRRQALRTATFALVFAGAGLAALYLVPPAPFAGGPLATEIGEVRTTKLADGSVLVLDAGTRLQVTLGQARREVRLLSGRARFDVAKDPSRPFVVSSGENEIEAIGTSFDVIRRETGTVVLLREGVVALRTPADASASANAGAVATMMAPGEQIAVGNDGKRSPKRIVQPEADAAAAWKRRVIEATDQSLEDLLADANRYGRTRIVLTDASLKDRKISGVFHADDTQTIVAVLERYFGLRASWRGDGTVVLERS